MKVGYGLLIVFYIYLGEKDNLVKILFEVVEGLDDYNMCI